MNVGNRIKQFRNNAGLTQEQLAKKCNLSKNAIWNYENGKRTPTIDVLNNISKALEVPINDLMADTEEKNVADALFGGDLKKAMYNTINEEEMNSIKNDLIFKYAGNDKAASEIKVYFDLIYYIIRENFIGNIRESFEFCNNISVKDFEDIMKDLKAVAIGKITLLKIKSDLESNNPSNN